MNGSLEARKIQKLARNAEAHTGTEKEKIRAQRAATKAIRDGKLKRKKCVVCGTIKNIHGHHQDYSKPLKVTWLCAKHHSQLHSFMNMKNTLYGSILKNIKEVKILLEKGLTITELSKTFGVSIMTLSRSLDKAGLRKKTPIKYLSVKPGEKHYIIDGSKIRGERYFPREELDERNIDAIEKTDGGLIFVLASDFDNQPGNRINQKAP